MTHYVDLPHAVPPELLSDFKGKLFYVSEEMSEFNIDDCRVQFNTKPGKEAAAHVIAARIRKVAEKMTAGHHGLNSKVIHENRPARYRFTENPCHVLEADDSLHRYGPGRFGIGPLLVGLEDYFEVGILRMADQLGAVRHRFPALIGVEDLYRSRYIQSFPHALTLASHLREDLESIQRFASEVGVNAGVLTHPPESVSGAKCMLAPSICFHYYSWLRDRKLDGPRTITAVGNCFRYESGNMSTLERLWDFRMREVVFVGQQDFVIAQRDRCIELTIGLLEEWGLGYVIKSATDPFFIEGYTTQVAFQSAFELKFEIRADLPYETDKSLAVGSFNFHQDFFGRSMGITGPLGDPVCTGCVGFGLERLVWAFISQHGSDPSGWPELARATVVKRGVK